MTPRAGDGGHAADAAARELAVGFARQIAAWSSARAAAPGAVAVLRHVAMALSLATSEGHVCIGLAQAAAGLAEPPGDAALRTLLLASGLVGTPAAPGAAPMILDGDGRLYLHRYFDYERRLAQRLVQAARVPADASADDTATRERLAALFAPAAGPGAVDWQQAAAALAMRRRLVIISGGPGTGKTTTVVKLLACLLAQQPDARIALTAPTGKAAARMSEAIRERAALLPVPEALQARLPQQASTVHRLLGPIGGRPGPGGFVHDAGNPLAIDVLVVDEASMLDLALATRLLEAVPPHARIVLLGDKDQLSAVESGSVFAEISADASLGAACTAELEALCRLAPGSIRAPMAAPVQAASPLRDTVVWFTQNFRFAADSGIGRLAADINAARSAPALQALQALQALHVVRGAQHRGDSGNGDDSVRWLPGPAADVLPQLMDGYAPFIAALRRDPHDVAAVTAAFNRFRVLCAVREGPRGTAAINAQMAQALGAALGAALGHGRAGTHPEWYLGRPVMVLRNDPVLKLYNGDIGVALPDANDGTGALMAYFPAPGGTGWRAIPPLRLPAHQTAFAMTVHKAQGSEFDTVLVVLPERRSRVATRELLYTAVTRARQRVLLCAGADVLTAAIQSPTQRHSGLLARLAEAAAAHASQA